MVLPPEETLLVFVPVLFRVGGILMAGPLWNHGPVPLPVKTGVTLVTTIAMWPLFSGFEIPEIHGVLSLGLVVGKELLTGLLLGFVANVIFAGVEFAGQMVGITMGLAIVNVFDPIHHVQVSIMARLHGLFALAIFFALDVHHVLFRAIASSYRVVPLGGFALSATTISNLIEMGYGIFVIGVRIAAPALAVLLLADLAMGLVARTVPQMNVFIVGFPLKIGLGFLMITFTMPILVGVLRQLFAGLERDLSVVLSGM